MIVQLVKQIVIAMSSSVHSGPASSVDKSIKPVGREHFEAFECAILACDINRLETCVHLWPQIERWQQSESSACHRRLLHTAARLGHPSTLRTLLQFNRKHELNLLNSLDSDQLSPLHVTIVNGHEPAVHLFLDFGAKIDAVGRCTSALWLAVQVLAKSVSEQQAKDNRHDLSSVITASSTSVANSWLQDLKANGEQQAEDNVQKRVAIVRLLMSYSGPEVWLRKDSHGRNVLDLARQHQLSFILDSPFAAVANVFAHSQHDPNQ
jgi:hypothetical protein